jgi:hypothetical protein
MYRRMTMVLAALVAAGATALLLVSAGPASAQGNLVVTGYPSNPTITVTGSHFGPHPPTDGLPASQFCPGDTGTDFGVASGTWFLNATNQNFDGGYVTTTTGSCIGIVITSWSRTKVVFTLGSAYGGGMVSGNQVVVSIRGRVYFESLP